MTKERQFILTLNYKSDASDWDVISHDVIEAKSLTELLTKFNIVIASLHRKLIDEVKTDHIDYDDIPF
jgi:putative NADH-flavin reductase